MRTGGYKGGYRGLKDVRLGRKKRQTDGEARAGGKEGSTIEAKLTDQIERAS